MLLVAKLDRLSRDYATLTVLERKLQRHGVEVVSAAEENGDGPIAEFIRGQLALVAQLERAMIVERVSAGKAKKKQLEDKNRIIEQLEKARTGPVRALDNVSQSLEPLKLWLMKMNVKGNSIELEGRALTNDDIVEFVNNLRRTDYFTIIRLQESRAAVDNKMNLYQFKLDLSMKG